MTAKEPKKSASCKACHWPSSVTSEAATSIGVAKAAIQAFRDRPSIGRSSLICTLAIDTMKEAMMTKPSARYWPARRGSPAMTEKQMKAIAIPRDRRQQTLSLNTHTATHEEKIG